MGDDGHVSGVDATPGMLAVAQELAPSIEWREGVAESLPYEAESFDAVISQFGLMFFRDRTKALESMKRALAPYDTGDGLKMGFATWIVTAAP